MSKKIVNENILRKIIRSVLYESIDELNLYHGTNSDFDKFDFAYLSSGWGQQAYGYGFYLTTSYDAAKEYAYDANHGQVMEVEVPDGKYLTDVSISKAEANRIARIFFKYMTEENEDTRDSYPTEDEKRCFWDYEVDYIRRCKTGSYVYGTIASLMGSDKNTSEFLHDKCGYVGLKIRDIYNAGKKTPITYVIFNQNDIKIINKNVIKENIATNQPGNVEMFGHTNKELDSGVGKFGIFKLSPALMSCIYEAAFQLLGYERFAIDGEIVYDNQIMDNPWDDAYSIIKWAIDNKGLDEKYLGRVSSQYSDMDDNQFRNYIKQIENGKIFWFSREELSDIFRVLPDALRKHLVQDMLNVGRTGKIRATVEQLKQLNGGENLDRFIEIIKQELKSGNVKRGSIANLKEPVRLAMQTTLMLGSGK